MKENKKGWIVTWAAMGINLACGMLYSWSIFAAALVQDMGLTKTQAALPYTVAIAMLALLAIPSGKLQDRLGPRFCVTICGVLCGLGLILSGYATSIIMLTLTFGLITGSGLGFAQGALTPAAVKWFPPQRRGLISGIVVGGVGLASVYVAPLAQYLINEFGVRNAFVIEGVFFAIVILILAQFLASPPAGYIPEGASLQSFHSCSVKPEYSPKEMMATSQFKLIWLMYGLGSVAGLMIIGHLAIIAQVQANIEWAFIFIVILGIFNALGRVMGGFLSDKLGSKKTLVLMFSIQAVNMLLFASYNTSILLTIGISVVGICYGALLGIFPALTFDYFGLKNGGVNYGLVFSSWGVAGIVGPIMAGYIVDVTSSYHTAYLMAAGLLVLSTALALMLKPTYQDVRT